MLAEGRLHVTVVVGDGEVLDVSLTSTRPQNAAGALVGRSVDEALRLAPLLFSLCGTAHGLAVAEAAERAAGMSLAPAHRRARDVLVAVDILEGHGWTVLLDWPKLLGEAPGAPVLAALKRLTMRVRTSLYPEGDALSLGGGRLAPSHGALVAAIDGIEELVREHLVGGRTFAEDARTFHDWARRGETAAARLVDRVLAEGMASSLGSEPTAPLLRELDAPWFDARLADPAFGPAPTFEGHPAEVGPLARMAEDPLVRELVATWGRGILARLGARLAELAGLPLRLRELVDGQTAAPPGGPPPPATGHGVGLVATSRGPLAYRLDLVDGRVAAAASVAPTEWNFHPDGVLAQTMRGAPVHGASRRATLTMASLDPCVPFDVQVRHVTAPPEADDA